MKKLIFGLLMLVCVPCFGMRSAKDFSRDEATRALGYMAEVKKGINDALAALARGKYDEAHKTDKAIYNGLRGVVEIYNIEGMPAVDGDQAVAADVQAHQNSLAVFLCDLLGSAWENWDIPTALANIEKVSKTLADDLQQPFKISVSYILLCDKLNGSWMDQQETILKPIAEK